MSRDLTLVVEVRIRGVLSQRGRQTNVLKTRHVPMSNYPEESEADKIAQSAADHAANKLLGVK